jgi:hypothetical protein
MGWLQLLSCELPWLVLARELARAGSLINRAGSLIKNSNESSSSRATNKRVERASELRVFIQAYAGVMMEPHLPVYFLCTKTPSCFWSGHSFFYLTLSAFLSDLSQCISVLLVWYLNTTVCQKKVMHLSLSFMYSCNSLRAFLCYCSQKYLNSNNTFSFPGLPMHFSVLTCS